FQAEDGIRDKLVTGVQTCALPISTRLAGRVVFSLGARVAEPLGLPELTHVFPRPDRFEFAALSGLGMTKARAGALAGIASAVIRSEERRVGRGGRCRGASAALDCR